VLAVKARVDIQHGDSGPIIPIFVPELEEVRRFAQRLHALRQPWDGEAFGWQAEYHPSQAEAPIDSKMTFTPADFCIGESGIWFFSMMWEHGDDAAPVEYVDDRAIVWSAKPERYLHEHQEDYQAGDDRPVE
jgi:hypothetical protein